MYRVFRLGDFIRKMNIDENIKAIINLFKLLFYLFIWCHATGCMWYYTCLINRGKLDSFGNRMIWYTPTEWVFFEDYQYMKPDADTFFIYLVSFYYANLMLASNEMGPVNDIEIFVAAVLLLIKAFVFLFLFGEIATIIQILNKKSTKK